jgi:hypothetical protein
MIMENEISTLEAQVAELQKQLNSYNYDYKVAVKADAISYIEEMLEYGTIEVVDLTTDDGREKISDLCWNSDQVTGNASGSYTFSTYVAECNICHNMSLYAEALDEFGVGPKNELDPEYIDVTIRCYVLDQVLNRAIDAVLLEHKDELDEGNEDEN